MRPEAMDNAYWMPGPENPAGGLTEQKGDLVPPSPSRRGGILIADSPPVERRSEQWTHAGTKIGRAVIFIFALARPPQFIFRVVVKQWGFVK